MARARRSTRTSAPKPAEDPAAEPVQSSASAKHEKAKSTAQTDDDSCPACVEAPTTDAGAADKESWVRCDACKTWYHWRCAGDGGDLERIDKWFCKDCLMQDSSRRITEKPPARKSSRKRTNLDYANLNSGLGSDPNRWLKMLEGKDIKPDNFRRMKGSEVTKEWLDADDNALKEPIVIENPEGLGMKMPGKGFTVDDVAKIIGEDTPVEVIDVASQSNSPGWNLKKWSDYYASDPSTRDKIRNVISLEVSGTKLADMILPPKIVRDLDWVEKFWPSSKKGKGQAYPKVQLYCLMGVGQAWTDWHIDFAGSSVYYHILCGAKVFYFIKPTPANLAAYERWSGTDIQNHTWLGDMADEVVKVELQAGNTMIIPTGWIHAVYTPVDTLVFGGNFLHSYNVATQLKVRDIEIATHVPKRFRFPMFTKLCWYAGEKYLRDLKAKEEFSTRVLESIQALADFLVSEARVMERGTEAAKRDTKERVPGDRVKDAPALARELRWRVKQAAGQNSDDEEREKQAARTPVPNGYVSAGTGVKRRRIGPADARSFKNFKPRPWDKVAEKPMVTETQVVKVRKPAEGQELAEEWIDGVEGKSEEGPESEEADVSRRRDVIVKVRRIEGRVERQRIERTVEEYTWSGGSSMSTLNGGSPSDKMDVDLPEGGTKEESREGSAMEVS